jgi:hypothetical protein
VNIVIGANGIDASITSSTGITRLLRAGAQLVASAARDRGDH